MNDTVSPAKPAPRFDALILAGIFVFLYAFALALAPAVRIHADAFNLELSYLLPFAGWLAGKFMDVRFGVLMNIIIGIVGAAIASAVFRRFGVFVEGDWLGYLITSFVGACILLFVVKLVRR